MKKPVVQHVCLRRLVTIVLAALLIFPPILETVSANEQISHLVLSKNELFMETGDTQALTATAIYVSGKTENVTLKAKWTSHTPDIASVNVGTITAKNEGPAIVSVEYMAQSVDINVTVTKKVTSLSANQQNINMRAGAGKEVQIKLTARFSDGTQKEITSEAEWTSSDYAVATVSNGLVTGQGSGTATITAKYGNQSVTIPVNVDLVRRLDPSSTQVSLLVKGKAPIKLMAIYPDGDEEDVAKKAKWLTDNEGVADVLQGEITAYGPGQATLTADYGGKIATIQVDVDTTSRLTVNKQSLFMKENTTETLILEATYVDGSTEDITDQATWSSSNEAVAYVHKGKISAYKAGEAEITAKYGDRSITITVDVEVPRILEITPDYIFLRTGTNGEKEQQLKLFATYANGNKEEITSKATWKSSNEAVAFVSTGKVTARKSGEAQITATFAGKTASINVDVDISNKLVADKPSVAIQVGDSQQVKITAIYGDGEENVTDQVQWSSSASSIAEVRKGLITGVSTGTATITAKYGTRTISIPVSVGVVNGLTVNEQKLVLSQGDTHKLTVTANYADGTSKDVTAEAEWKTSKAEVAQVDAGTVTAIASGKATITATHNGKAVSVQVEVDQANSIRADLRNIVMDINGTQQINLTATDSLGQSRNITNEAEWKSSSASVVEVNQGLVRGLKKGKATITAKYGGQTVTIAVEVGIIQKLEVDKSFLSLKTVSKDDVDKEAQLVLTATFSDGRTSDVTAAADWKTSSYKVAEVRIVNDQVFVRATGSGKTKLTAKYGGKTISIPVDVDTLKYLKTDVVQVEMRPGDTVKVTAIATFMDNSDENVSIPALWTSSKILVADVKDGIIKATTPGKATITVSFGGKKTKINVIVK